MVTVTLPPSRSRSTQRITLEGISWHTYQVLIHEMSTHRATRLAYDKEILEITMPSDLHEMINRLLDRMVTALTEELGLKIRAYGSTTLDREDLATGIEPDSCYYIQNVDQLRKGRLDLTVDPPPDLAIEVDISSASRRRFGIYRQLQVPEIWQFTQANGVVIWKFHEGEYVVCEASPTFPMITHDVLKQFMTLAEEADDNAVIRFLRMWVREQAQ